MLISPERHSRSDREPPASESHLAADHFRAIVSANRPATWFEANFASAATTANYTHTNTSNDNNARTYLGELSKCRVPANGTDRLTIELLSGCLFFERSPDQIKPLEPPAFFRPFEALRTHSRCLLILVGSTFRTLYTHKLSWAGFPSLCVHRLLAFEPNTDGRTYEANGVVYLQATCERTLRTAGQSEGRKDETPFERTNQLIQLKFSLV